MCSAVVVKSQLESTSQKQLVFIQGLLKFQWNNSICSVFIRHCLVLDLEGMSLSKKKFYGTEAKYYICHDEIDFNLK